ncbi:glycosyltransferase family 9 protein [Oscillibacter sp.]|uniref:glycosyltransferase family 9 protein n=1 Tax=Oscillibacter sp. TaxID=1945593 RepID=UPI0028A04B6B|nr:glycosyltransferase family 9 protein [Oscillibacter sp.]
MSSSFKQQFKQMIGTLIYGSLLTVFPFPRKRTAEKSSPPRQVAVVCLAALGDLITFCPAAQQMRSEGLRLTLICREGGGIAEFAAETGLFEAVIALPHRFRSRIANLRRLGSLSAELVVVAPVQRHILSDLYALAIPAQRRVLPDTTAGCAHLGLKKRVDRQVDLVPVTAQNELERNAQYSEPLGLVRGPLSPFVFRGEKGAWQKTEPSCVAIFPGAGGSISKCWPVERFAWVARQLAERTRCRVLIFGTAAERSLCGKLAALLPETARDLSGQTTLAELAQRLKGCCLSLTNDSGSAHLSIAHGVPTVIVCGGWEYGRFYPNPTLPPDCRAVLAKELPSCVPCGQSKPDCSGRACAPCVAAVRQETVLEAALACMVEGKRF